MQQTTLFRWASDNAGSMHALVADDTDRMLVESSSESEPEEEPEAVDEIEDDVRPMALDVAVAEEEEEAVEDPYPVRVRLPTFYYSRLVANGASELHVSRTRTRSPEAINVPRRNLAHSLIYRQMRGCVTQQDKRSLSRSSISSFSILSLLIPPRPLPDGPGAARRFRICDMQFDQYDELLACANAAGYLVVWNYEEYLDSIVAFQHKRARQRRMAGILAGRSGSVDAEYGIEEPGLRVLFGGDPCCCIKLGNSPHSLAWNPVNSSVVGCGFARFDAMQFFDLETCPRFGTAEPIVSLRGRVARTGVRDLAYMPGNSKAKSGGGRPTVVAAGFDGSLSLWDLRSARGPAVIASGLSAPRGNVMCLRPDVHFDENIVYCGTDKGALHICDVRKGLGSVASMSLADLGVAASVFVPAAGAGRSRQVSLSIQSVIPHPVHNGDVAFQTDDGICGVVDVVNRHLRFSFSPPSPEDLAAAEAESESGGDYASVSASVVPIPTVNHRPSLALSSRSLDALVAAHMGSVYVVGGSGSGFGSGPGPGTDVFSRVPVSACSGAVAGHSRSGSVAVGMVDGGLRVIGGPGLVV